MRIDLRFAVNTILLSLFIFLSPSTARAQNEAGARIAPTVASILVRDEGTGRFEAVGSGVFVRGDGVLLTAYTLLQGAREIQVRLANGETYDKPELVATDERRNVAVLRIHASATPFVLVGTTGESAIGASVQAVYNAGGQVVAQPVGVLSSVSLADEIPGAGTGFRVLKFTAPLTPEAAGGVLVDSHGRALGLIAPLPQSRGQQGYAVPLYNIVGLVRSGNIQNQPATTVMLAPDVRNLNRAIPIHQSSTTPLEPMPQVAVPQRPTTPLAPAGPGSVVVKETDPAKLLLASRTLYVTSRSNLFKPFQLLNELRKRDEFAHWNLSFVDDYGVADLVLTIEHVPLTWEFSFSVRHQRTGVIIAMGKTYAWGGGDGALIMAGRVVDRFTKLRAMVRSESKTETSAPAKP
jgi:hypothetical protein